MEALAINLDHLGTAVEDLDAGRLAFEKLGFRMTPRSQHRGAAAPGGPVELFGQGNHCAMLEQGYLEVLGIFDRTLPTPAQQYLDRYEGLHIVGLKPGSIDRLRALARGGGALDAPRELGREVDFGPKGLERRRAEFINVKFRPAVFPEATFLYTQHLTPDVIWQPHLLAHPNRAQALQCVYICASDAQGLADRLAGVLQVPAETVGPGLIAFRLESSSLRIVTPEAWERMFPAAPAPRTPRPVGFVVRTSSLESAVDQLDRNGIPFQRCEEGGVYVRPDFACGNVIHFTESH
ncbi:MAG: VOC family protein [Pseudomonadota bacterium]